MMQYTQHMWAEYLWTMIKQLQPLTKNQAGLPASHLGLKPSLAVVGEHRGLGQPSSSPLDLTETRGEHPSSEGHSSHSEAGQDQAGH